MNRLFVKLFAAASLNVVVTFGATVTVTMSSTDPFPNGDAAPYLAYINGSSNLSTVVCDDDTGDYVWPGESWTATETSLATILAAAGGNPSVATSGLRFSPDATSLYEEVGWLALQFSSNPSQLSDIQTAIWDVFNYPGTTQTTNSAYWLSQAQKPSNYNGALTLSMASEIFFLTPVAGTQSPAYTANPQEFILIGSTPEPASYAMFGIGVILLSLGTFHRSRKRE